MIEKIFEEIFMSQVVELRLSFCCKFTLSLPKGTLVRH